MSSKILPSIDIVDIDMTKCWFNPGCAMSSYKPYLNGRMLKLPDYRGRMVSVHDFCLNEKVLKP